MENRYTNKVKSKSNSELNSIVHRFKDFDENLVKAAVIELETRGEINDKSVSVLEKIEKKNAQKSKVNRIRKEPFIPKDLPNSIKYSAYLIYLSGFISALTYSFIPSVHLSIGGFQVSFSLILVGLLGAFVHRGSVTAKWIWVIIYGMGSVVLFINILSSFSIGLISIIQSLIQLISVVLLFLPDSKKWYKAQRGEQVEEEEFIFKD